MKGLLRPLLIGLACGPVALMLSGWTTFWILLRYYGFDQVPTDPDYHAAIAIGSEACFIQASICGCVVALATVALVTRDLYRRNKARLSESIVPGR